MTPIELGDKYRDAITGFTGTATSRTEYLYGCVRIVLEGGVNGEVKTEVFDEPRLTRLDGEPVKPTATTGGDRSTPTGPAIPSR